MNFDAEVERIARRVLASAAPAAPSPDDWLPHTAWPFPRNRAAALASSGLIAARRDGRIWYARRRHIDAFVESLPSAPAPSARAAAGDAPAAPTRRSITEMAREAARRSRSRAA